MKLCIINSGVVHAQARTLAIFPYFSEIHYINCANFSDRAGLKAVGVRWYGPDTIASKFSKFFGFFSLLEKINPDAIVCHYASGDYFFQAIAYNRCPVAAIAMGTDIQYDEGDVALTPIRQLLTRMSVRSCAYISAKSTKLADRIRCYGYTGSLDVNLWGSDLSLFHPGDQISSRLALGLPVNDTIILSPRAIEPRLNIDLIVKAVAALTQRYPSLLLVILGRTQAAYREKIESLINELNLHDRVRLVYSVDQESLPAYLVAANVVVSMGRSEGFPNTVLEAMACGVPNVVGRIPAVSAVLTDQVNARLCELDVNDIANTLDEVLSDPTGGQCLADRALALARSSADITENGQRFAIALKAIVESGAWNPMHAKSVFMLRVAILSYSVLRKLRMVR